MSNYYLGNTPQEQIGDSPRFFYALRRNENGSLFLIRSDQLRDSDTITINEIGNELDNYDDFEAGVDFFEGRNVNHELIYPNLKYEQYRWDDRSIFYYVNDEGELVVRVNRGYEYDDTVSEN
jgi:hypothetical protein